MRLRMIPALFLTLAFSLSAHAVPIVFVHTGAGSGSLAGTPFTDASFTITSVGDTADRQSFAAGYFIDHISSSIDISGVGVLTFLTPTRTFVNVMPQVGFSRAGASGQDLYNGPTDAAFAGWDMTTSIGTVTGLITLLQWGSSPVSTSAGVLLFADGTQTGTFTATVPEPGTLALAAIALLGIAIVTRISRA